jgi:hypothetical protein
VALPLLAVLTVVAIACNDDDEGGGDDAAAIEQTIRDAIAAYNNAQAEEFYSYFTDEGLAALFEVPVEELESTKAEFEQFIGEDPLEVREVRNVEVDGDDATAEMIAASVGVLQGDRFALVNQEDAWKINGYEGYAVSPDTPDGYTELDMVVQEFAFGVDIEQIEAGNVAFNTENVGQQDHEAVLARLDEGVVLEEALMSEGDPEGVELMARIVVTPGQTYNMVLVDPLEAGRYAFVCFFPDTDEGPEGTPHAFKGMVQEFTVD